MWSSKYLITAPTVKVVRQDTDIKIQDAAMSTKDGQVIAFNADGVYKAATDAGLKR
jgi:tRNA A37 threonylcarbamoyladenosine synthetase subunit TsaC/SUA5/YrdC